MGFDFDEIEEQDPSADPDELRRQEAEEAAKQATEAAQSLKAEAWNVRRDACKALATLGEAAAPHMGELMRLSKFDSDYEVRKASGKAFAQLKEKGIEPLVVEDPMEAMKKKQAIFKIFKEELPMSLEKPDITPLEICEIWEKSWGIQYASRVKFLQPLGSDSEAKHLNPREDSVPRSPHVIGLECSVGSILGSLAVALKNFGAMTPEEAEAERDKRRMQQEEAKQKRAQADIRQREERQKQERRRRRQIEEGVHEGQPWREQKLFLDPAEKAAAAPPPTEGPDRPWRKGGAKNAD